MKRDNTLFIVLKPTGSLLIMLGIIVSVPSLVSLLYAEWFSALGFILSGAIISGTGLGLFKIFNKADEVHYNHALIVVASAWLIITLAGGLPFFIISHITPAEAMKRLIPDGAAYEFSSLIYFRNYLHCFFESMSAFTTTGLSMAVHEPSIGKGILFYRSFAQWIGGAGFIIMVLAIFRQISGKGAIMLYGGESNGVRLQPKVISTTRSIWKIYLGITLFSFVYLVLGTYLILPDYPFADTIFDAINHAMSGQSTGGFSTLDDSIASYKSPYMDMLYLLPMILGSFSLPFFYSVIVQKNFKQVWYDIQTRWLIIAFIVGGLIQSLLLLRAGSVPQPFREGIFQFVSAMSTTGWQTSNMGNWDWVSVLFISFAAMFIGGASGATVGGIKMIRAQLIQKVLRFQIRKTFYSPRTVKLIHFNQKNLLEEDINEEFTKAVTLAALFVLLIIGSSILVASINDGVYDLSDVLIESVSAQCTVGLSSGVTDPSMSVLAEIIYIFQMWTGRLEIIPVLALFRAVLMGTNP